MNTVVIDSPRIAEIEVTPDTIIAVLTDGRSVSVPLAWSWRLSEATPQQRANFEIIGNGLGVHWPDIDEDLSASGMLFGIPALPRSSSRRTPDAHRSRESESRSVGESVCPVEP